MAVLSDAHAWAVLLMPLNDVETGWVSAASFMICLLCVHLCFRHVFTLMWLSTKIVVAGIVFLQVRDFVLSQVDVFGVPPGTVDGTASICLRVLQAWALTTVGILCPTCVPAPPPPHAPSSPWTVWMSDTLMC
jgi:hypothetical protein